MRILLRAILSHAIEFVIDESSILKPVLGFVADGTLQQDMFEAIEPMIVPAAPFDAIPVEAIGPLGLFQLDRQVLEPRSEKNALLAEIFTRDLRPGFPIVAD